MARGQLVLQDLTAGPSSTAPIGSNVGMVVAEAGPRPRCFKAAASISSAASRISISLRQDSRFRTVIAALNGNDPNNGTLCFGLNCAHYLAEQGANR